MLSYTAPIKTHSAEEYRRLVKVDGITSQVRPMFQFACDSDKYKPILSSCCFPARSFGYCRSRTVYSPE